jgi:hypothetical protein
MFLTLDQLNQINKEAKLGFSASDIKAIVSEKFADLFLAKLGFTNIRIMDASDYEGADIIHDLNKPLPEELRGTVRFLYDGGTLEHVFDVATALKSVINLLAVDGIALFASPASGQCGHGFYQFSPELFYRVLQANGFDDVVVYLTSTMGPRRWFEATDPRTVRRRIQFMSGEPLLLITIARKAKDVPEFVIPQQSDYSDIAWRSSKEQRRTYESGFVRFRSKILYRIAYPLQILLRHTTGFCFGTGMPGLWKQSLFKPVNPFQYRLFETSVGNGQHSP